MDHKEIEWVGMDRIILAQDKNKWLTLVTAVIIPTWQ
jgi:hypothetical protein